MKTAVIISLGGLSFFAYIINLFAIYTFSKSIRELQFHSIIKKLGTIVLIFLVATFLYRLTEKIALAEESLIIQIFRNVIYGFSAILVLISAISVSLSSLILYKNDQPKKVYFVFSITVLLSFGLGILLRNLIPFEDNTKSLMWLSPLIFLVVLFQIFLLNGKYILQKYLADKNIKISNSFFSEYIVSLRHLRDDFFSLREITNSANKTIEFEVVEALEYKNFIYDILFILFTTILGCMLILLNTDINIFQL